MLVKGATGDQAQMLIDDILIVIIVLSPVVTGIDLPHQTVLDYSNLNQLRPGLLTHKSSLGLNTLMYDFLYSQPLRHTGVKSHKPNRPKMLIIIYSIQMILTTGLVGCVAGKNKDAVHKRQMCLKYEMEDHTSTIAVIDRYYYCSKVECMASCTRHHSCNTFHFRATDCACELLNISNMCMTHNVTNGTILVGLTLCKQTPPWKVITPTQRKLQWMEPRYVGSQRFILTTLAATRQIARVLHDGTYVPGFVLISKRKFIAFTMEGRSITCSEAFQVLTYVQPHDYFWINFAPGDDVPVSAVVGGYGRDGTPLYVIIGQFSNAVKPGFYNGATEQIYVKNKKMTPVTVFLLLESY